MGYLDFALNGDARLSDVLFNIGVETFRHATIGLPFRSSSAYTRVMGRFMDLWYATI